MIELTFGEGSAGALKHAKTMKHGEQFTNRTEGCETDKDCSRVGMPMDGSAEDVAPLSLYLDIGDISDLDKDLNSRKMLLDLLFKNFQGVPEEMWRSTENTLSRLQEAKETLEPVRMWICACDPSELCGLYFICSLMADSRTPLSVVRIPEQFEKGDCIISYRSTGEIHPEDYSDFLKYEEPLNALKQKVYSIFWNNLLQENAPLRAIINGSLISVPEDFYDFALRANMPEGEFKVALLIGKALGMIPGIGDTWLFLRVQAMLQSGELIMISEPKGDNPYSGVLKVNAAFRK